MTRIGARRVAPVDDFPLLQALAVFGSDPLRTARDNKVLDLYVEHADLRDASSLKGLRAARRSRRREVRRTVADLAPRLAELDIDWAAYKTLRPFTFCPTDIDVIVFSEGGARRAGTHLAQYGYKLSGRAPHTLTLQDPDSAIDIDFYTEIAASHFIYLDKWALHHLRNSIVLDTSALPCLAPAAELLSILAHAVYKEQMFTLADYLTLRTYAANGLDWGQLLAVANATGSARAVLLCLRLAHGIADRVGDAKPWPVPTTPLRVRCLPYRLLNPVLLGPCLIDKLRASPRARVSLGRLLVRAADLSSPYTREFYRQLWLRLVRRTY